MLLVISIKRNGKIKVDLFHFYTFILIDIKKLQKILLTF